MREQRAKGAKRAVTIEAADVSWRTEYMRLYMPRRVRRAAVAVPVDPDDVVRLVEAYEEFTLAGWPKSATHVHTMYAIAEKLQGVSRKRHVETFLLATTMLVQRGIYDVVTEACPEFDGSPILTAFHWRLQQMARASR